MYGKPLEPDWVARVIFLIQIRPIFGGLWNRYFWGIRLKICRSPNFYMLFQLVLTKFFKSELLSCSPKVDHVINYCKRPIYAKHHYKSCYYLYKLSLRLIHRNTLKFQDESSLWTDQKSALQHSLVWRYANFSKLMPTIHTSMANSFQYEHCQRFTFTIAIKVMLKCTRLGGMY